MREDFASPSRTLDCVYSIQSQGPLIMVFPRESKATSNNDAVVKSAPSSRKRKASDDGARPGRSSKRQATTPRRTTRSMLKKLNEGSPTPVSLVSGIEAEPRRRRGLRGGNQASGAANRPQEGSKAPEELGNMTEPHPQTARRVSEEEVAAATRLARAAVLAGLTMSSPIRDSHVIRRCEGRAHPTEQVVATLAAEAAGDAEAAQDGTPPTELNTSLPRPTIMPDICGIDGRPDTHRRGLDKDQSCPVADAVGEGVGSQATVDSTANNPEAAREWPEGRAAARTDADIAIPEKTKTLDLTPGSPSNADIPSPQRKRSASGQAQSRDPSAASKKTQTGSHSHATSHTVRWDQWRS